MAEIRVSRKAGLFFKYTNHLIISDRELYGRMESGIK